MKRYGGPEVVVTDKLRSYGAAMNVVGNADRQETGRWCNNWAENSHLPFRRRERAMLRFRQMRCLQKFAAVHSVNKGRDSVRRPDFTREEYATLIRKLPSWIDAGREGKSRDMRHLLRDYILILANTGMRHGTEAENLCWKHISLFEDKGLKYLEMSVTGKTGRRDIICRAGTINYLKRIQSRCPDIADMSFEQLIKSKLDVPVFRLPDGTASANLRQTFKIFMKDTGLLTCPRTGQDRTLYSLRHTYATFSLLNDGMDVHTLAVQMGTSILMIERHYSHLTPRLKKEMLTGKRYDTPHKDYTADLSNGFAVTDEDLQRAIDDVEIEEKLPNEPKATAVAKAGLKRSVEYKQRYKRQEYAGQLKSVGNAPHRVSIRKICPCSNRHTSRRLQCCARPTHQGA